MPLGQISNLPHDPPQQKQNGTRVSTAGRLPDDGLTG